MHDEEILKVTLRKQEFKDVQWNDLTMDNVQCHISVNSVMKS